MWRVPGLKGCSSAPSQLFLFQNPSASVKVPLSCLRKCSWFMCPWPRSGRAHWRDRGKKIGECVHEGSLNFLGVDPLSLLLKICKNVDFTNRAQLWCNQNTGGDTAVAFVDPRVVKVGTWGQASSTPSFPVGESLTLKLHEVPHLWGPSLTLVSPLVLCHRDQHNNAPQSYSHPNLQNPWPCHLIWQRDSADVTTLRSWDREVILDYPGRPDGIQWSCKHGVGGWQKGCDNAGRGCNDGGPQAKECRCLQKQIKTRKQIVPRRSPEGNTDLPTHFGLGTASTVK